MADIHRINDPSPNNNRSPNRVYQYQQLGPNAHRIPFLIPAYVRECPRDESYWDMLRFAFCPKVKFISFTTFLLITNTVLFIISIKEGIQREGSLLQVKSEVLIKFGAMVPNEVRSNYAFYLLLTSLFLSLDFINYLINSICIMILSSTVESSIGSFHSSIICIGGGIMGSLFGAMAHCCTDQPYLEMPACVYALLGSLLGFFILNWDALSQMSEMRCITLCLMIMLLFLICLVTLTGGNALIYDKIGSIGGLLGGFFLTLAVAPPVVEGQFERKASIFGWTFTNIQIIVSLIMLYVADPI